MTFDDLSLAPSILRAVHATGYTHPTPIQAQSIPHIIEGKDLLGSAQTGTGKTAAFALPILNRLVQLGPGPKRGRRPRVLVLAPTRELSIQIGESFAIYGQFTDFRQVRIFGGVGQRPQTDALQRGVDIIVATPGRLCDLMGQGYVDLSGIQMFVLDEADRMLDMGFMPDIRRIIAGLPDDRQTVFFSATMPGPIEELANSILRDPVRVTIAPVKATTELISQSVQFVNRSNKGTLLAHHLKNLDVSRAIVFTRTKHGADRVVRHLFHEGIRAEAMHGNKSQAARQRTLADFKSQRTKVLVATDIAARGIDVDGISHVFNFDLPHEPETYVHRIGRTGRAGQAGIAIAFCDGSERKLLGAIEREMKKKLVVEPTPENWQPSAGYQGDAGDEAPRPRGPQQRPGMPQQQRFGNRPPQARGEQRPPRQEQRRSEQPAGEPRAQEGHQEQRPPRTDRPRGPRPNGAQGGPPKRRRFAGSRD